MTENLGPVAIQRSARRRRVVAQRPADGRRHRAHRPGESRDRAALRLLARGIARQARRDAGADPLPGPAPHGPRRLRPAPARPRHGRRPGSLRPAQGRHRGAGRDRPHAGGDRGGDVRPELGRGHHARARRPRPNACASRSNSATRRRWRRSASSPAASPTTSTTSWARSWVTRNWCATAPTTESRDDLDRLLQAAARGKHVIDRILRFTRRQDTERRLTDLAMPVAETVQLLRSTLPAADRVAGDPRPTTHRR